MASFILIKRWARSVSMPRMSSQQYKNFILKHTWENSGENLSLHLPALTCMVLASS